VTGAKPAVDADVLIVGAGVAGSLAGWALAQAGAKTLILEAGPRVVRAEAFAAFRRAPARTPEAPYPEVPHAPRPVSGDPHHYYLQDGPDLFKSTYERLVGGTTWHWLGTTLRFLPQDFRLKTGYGVGTDWPITYDQIEPWYCKAEEALGVAGGQEVLDVEVGLQLGGRGPEEKGHDHAPREHGLAALEQEVDQAVRHAGTPRPGDAPCVPVGGEKGNRELREFPRIRRLFASGGVRTGRYDRRRRSARAGQGGPHGSAGKTS